VAVGLMGMVIYLETTAYTATSMFLTSMAFILIACGNSLFGILTRQTSRMMGEMTYSIYLLHGFLFYMTFNHVLGLRAMTSLTPLQHWVLILSLTPVLILLSGLSYKFVELPAMQHAPRLAARLRRA
jgi:peptidoglycan/LPS O-acetylase OafA/YrhL